MVLSSEMMYLKKADEEIFNLIQKERLRLERTLMMIPSENYTSRAVEEAVGSGFGNKYAEGYPLKRFYQGQKYADKLELLVIERAKMLFGVPHVNVQPYSGSPANFAVYHALLNPGETIMGLSLAFGGHLTHGAAVSATSRYFKSVQYELGKDCKLDYVQIRKLAKEHKPKILVAGVTAYPRLVDWKAFADIADEIGAYLLTDISHLSGLVVGDAYPSPVRYAHVITTTTHKTLRGPRGALIMVTEKGLKKDSLLPEKIDKSVFPGLQGGPHLNSIAGIGVALHEAAQPSFKKYAKQIVRNAKSLAEEMNKQGFSLIAGGTDSHLILADVRPFSLLGNTAAEALEAIGIVLNKNAVPWDPNPPFYPSGIRLGTPGVTSRNMKEHEMVIIAKAMGDTLRAVSKTKKRMKVTSISEKKKSVRSEIIKETEELAIHIKTIATLAENFPIPASYLQP